MDDNQIHAPRRPVVWYQDLPTLLFRGLLLVLVSISILYFKDARDALDRLSTFAIATDLRIHRAEWRLGVHESAIDELKARAGQPPLPKGGPRNYGVGNQ